MIESYPWPYDFKADEAARTILEDNTIDPEDSLPEHIDAVGLDDGYEEGAVDAS